jgi:hypothetical protein
MGQRPSISSSALVEDLVTTLNDFNVPDAAQQELLGVLAPMHDAIVEVPSGEAGTVLPESYKTAPALG